MGMVKFGQVPGMKPYHVLVYGTGAVGIYFGGKLFQSGFDVVFVDTPEKVETLTATGLHIRSNLDQHLDFQPVIVSDISRLPPQDLILVCVKSFQTYDIALKLLPVVKPATIAISLQNGLDNEKILSDILGRNLVVGAILYFNGELSDPSTVVQKSPGRIVFGELDHQRSEREEWLSRIFSHADINHRISPTITLDIWKKLIWNNAFNAISAITRTTLRQIYEFEGVYPTLLRMMKEVQQVALAEGVEITDAIIEELQQIDLAFSDVKTSMLKDIEAGETPELDALVGVVLQKAKEHDISTPVNQTVYHLIQLALHQTGRSITSPSLQGPG
jgi:2-dehydropantoate 2-reductase